MEDKSLLDMYDFARENNATTAHMLYIDTPITVGARDGTVLVCLSEDTSVAKEFDVEKLDVEEFEQEVSSFLRESQSN